MHLIIFNKKMKLYFPRLLVLLIIVFFVACEKRDPKFIRNLENCKFEISKIVLFDAITKEESNVSFKLASINFGKKVNTDKPRIGNLKIDNKEASFYYSQSNTVTTSISDGKVSRTNIFIQSLNPDFYDPELNRIPTFNLNSDGTLDLDKKQITGSIVFMEKDPNKVYKFVFYFK
jgi:hypothetical protein